MLVLCDFDGTVTEQDVTNLIWDRYIWPDWRDRLLPPYRAGEKTTLDLMSAGWSRITASEEELSEFMRPRVNIRAGFARLAETCGARGWPLHIVSCGLEWYLRALIPHGVPFHCYGSALNGNWRVTLPPGVELEPGQDFKIHIAEKLKARHPGLPVAFIGDGRNDFPVARTADRVFAVRDSTLARLCRESGKDALEIESFDEVVDALAG